MTAITSDWMTPEQKQILGWLERELAAIRSKRKELEERQQPKSFAAGERLRAQQKQLERLEQAAEIARDVLKDHYAREANRRMKRRRV